MAVHAWSTHGAVRACSLCHVLVPQSSRAQPCCQVLLPPAPLPLPQQLESVAKLRGLGFLRVLPGHGRRAQFADAADREAQLAALLAAEGYGGA